MANARHRILIRAERLVKARERAAGIGALKREILEPLREALKQGIVLVGPASEHEADELAAALFDELPWMGAAIEPLWRDMRVSAPQGAGAAFPADPAGGPAGYRQEPSGAAAGRAGRIALDLDRSGQHHRGVSHRGHRTHLVIRQAGPGRPVQLILGQRIANPIVFVDELDKGGTLHSSQGQPTSALPALLRSRLRIVPVPVRGPSRAEMITFAARRLRQRCESACISGSDADLVHL